MLIFLILTVVSSTSGHELLKHIDIVNSDPKSTWKAGQNFAEYITLDYIKGLCGALKDPDSERISTKVVDNLGDVSLPENFDPRDKWGDICPSVREVRDQGSCGSCWAFGATEAMTDRVCIASKGKHHAHISAEDLLACCTKCGFGCNGGYPGAAWVYYRDTGIVTGGRYNSSQGCEPYLIPSCDHHLPQSQNPCKGGEGHTPECKTDCRKGYNVSYTNDRHFGESPYRIEKDVKMIMNELYENGPVEGAFTVYADFPNYKSGVYKHVSGSALGGHAIKVLGWGVLDDTPYWLVANSWNIHWGDEGFFKILRGEDHCGIESGLVAGLPKLHRD